MFVESTDWIYSIYNLPTSDDVAVLINDKENVTNRGESIFRHRDNSLKEMSELSRHYDPLQYHLLFPHSRRVTTLQWTSFYLHLCTEGRRNHPIRKLFQQYIVDKYSKIET
ncbi:hypothetical protein ROZALSC1DRAFT_31570 [Rozella allomycis CSF55]|uniref:Uncharacterized protein n=1 Tax=Rozella allomycis (strain CSF55) TaxID=988480 RepID=A0A075AZT8_ROZAC|nr:hypothetical protein O9G_004328 [Rozella allomycis CSF55]RKP16511.1 hypothetical protein ROZALSC1DRAFT_31570 [Rozella allomycis CSF55]|eukprot:EPZ34212.1 hypothetical protein O9G_004328 [Rozella allomycis CSF55]